MTHRPILRKYTDPLGTDYLNINIIKLPVVTAGVMIDPKTGNIYPYIGPALATPGVSVTYSGNDVTTGWNYSASLVDLPGRDHSPDFLVNETQDRGTMQAQLDAGVQPPAQFILESDQPNSLLKSPEICRAPSAARTPA